MATNAFVSDYGVAVMLLRKLLALLRILLFYCADSLFVLHPVYPVFFGDVWELHLRVALVFSLSLFLEALLEAGFVVCVTGIEMPRFFHIEAAVIVRPMLLKLFLDGVILLHRLVVKDLQALDICTAASECVLADVALAR